MKFCSLSLERNAAVRDVVWSITVRWELPYRERLNTVGLLSLRKAWWRGEDNTGLCLGELFTAGAEGTNLCSFSLLKIQGAPSEMSRHLL